MVEVILELSLVVAIAAILAMLSRFIRQPPIIAYLVAGILVGPLFFNLVGPTTTSAEFMQVFARIGVAFLLFIVGLSLDFRVLKEVGSVSALAGFVQVFVTALIGFVIAHSLGFSTLPSIYLGLALAFSSTVVVVKILSDKKEIDTLHGRIALGILIVQDFVAAIVLMIIPFVGKAVTVSSLAPSLGLALLLIVVIFLLSTLVFPRLLHMIASHQEVLFLFGIAWALVLATAFDLLGFSLEIGALIAGMSLASTKYTLELGSKIKPLRDFFVVLFFVFFGSQLVGPISGQLITQALLLSAFVIIGKPLLVMVLLRIAGYQKKTNFLTGISLAQISEFSLVIMLAGFTLGHVGQSFMSLAVLVALVTIGVSSYGIYYSHGMFKRIQHLLGVFDGAYSSEVDTSGKKYDVFLFGYHRIGYKVLEALKRTNASVVVVDYNPKVIYALTKKGIDCIYGDSGNEEFLSELGIENASIVISTIPDTSVNMSIRDVLTRLKSKATFIATSEQPRTAIDLYEHGIDYVIVPHHLGGDYIASMIDRFKLDKAQYKAAGKDHVRGLTKSKNGSSYT